jgi:predicted N-acetyltransferase YhbS
VNEVITTTSQGPAELEGPTVAARQDIPGLIDLANRVFRPKPRPGDMGAEFPALFGAQNTDHLHVFRDHGRAVSHVGVLRQTMHTCGLDLPVACIGAVCTDPEYRKAGLAGRLVDLAIARSIEAGDLLMPISGKRTLYVSRGATSVGPQVHFQVPVHMNLPGGNDFRVRAWEQTDWPALAGLQARQPVRYVWGDREPSILRAIQAFGGQCLLAEGKDGTPAAVLLFCANHPMYGGQDGVGRVVQFVGDLRAIPALLVYAGRLGLTGLDWTVLTTSSPAEAWCLRRLGATGTSQATRWTIILLNLPKLVERIGPVTARCGVTLEARDGSLTVAASDTFLTLPEPGAQVELLFGHPGIWSESLAKMPMALRVACSGVLPIPLPDYGINYV